MWELMPVVSVSLVLAALSEVFSKKDSLGNYYEKKEKYMWFFIFLIMAIFAGLRTKYNDTSTYLETYVFILDSKLNLSELKWSPGNNPGFIIVSTLLKSFGFSNNGYLMFFAIITYFVFIWFIRKYSTDFLFSIFLFIVFLFTFPLAAIKQTVAIAFCLIGVDRAINKKWVPFVFWILIAELFHAYAFLYLIIPLLFFMPWKSNKSLLWILLFIAAGVMLRPLLGPLLEATESFGKNYTVEDFSGEGVHPLRLITCLVPTVLSYAIKISLKDPQNDFNKVDCLFLNLSIVCGGIMFIALFGTANYFARLALYFILFQCLTMPRLLNMVYGKWRVPLKIFAVLCYSYFFYYSNVYSGFASFDLSYDRIQLSDFHWLG